MHAIQRPDENHCSLIEEKGTNVLFIIYAILFCLTEMSLDPNAKWQLSDTISRVRISQSIDTILRRFT